MPRWVFLRAGLTKVRPLLQRMPECSAIRADDGSRRPGATVRAPPKKNAPPI